MANFKIAIINACNVLNDEEIEAVIPALQTQVHRDFAPVWGIDVLYAWAVVCSESLLV